MISEYLNKLKVKRYKLKRRVGDSQSVRRSGGLDSIDDNCKGTRDTARKVASRTVMIDSFSIDQTGIEKKRFHDKRIGQKRIGQEFDLGGGGMKGSSSNDSIRGWFGYMQYIQGFIGCVLALLALIHLPYPDPLGWLPYAAASILAFITLKTEISIRLSTILAIATAGMMFFFFAAFFLLVPKLEADWYMSQFGWAAVCRILSAFLMIPILSDYSCRLKAECREARAARRTSFFGVPSHIRPESR